MSRHVHAPLAPSASGRWLNCNGSVAANAKGGRSSFYAEQGTAAHELLEICLRLGVEPMKFFGTLIYKDFEVTEEMCAAVGHAIDIINAYQAKYPKAKLYIEKRVDPHHMLKCAKELCAGTLDIAFDNWPEELVIADYKHGAGIGVDVVDNTQLLLYLLGFVSQYALGRTYKKYTIMVVQPRHRHHEGPVRPVEVTHKELLAFAERVRKALRSLEKDPDTRTAGKWCTFCAAAGKCRTLAEYNMNMASAEFGALTEAPEVQDPHDLTNDQIAFIIAHTDVFERWLKAVYARAKERVLSGHKIKGLKLVHGRSTRFFANEEAVMKFLDKEGFDEDEYAPRKMVGVPGVEKLYAQRRSKAGIRLKKDDPRIPPALVKRIEWSKPDIHIAPETDSRPAVQRGEEFAEVPLEPTPSNARARKAQQKKAKQKGR